MLNLINIQKELIVNGVTYASPAEALEALKNHSGKIEIVLNKKGSAPAVEKKEEIDFTEIYRIEVRQYMTKKADIGFDFMSKHNNDNPMPLRVMYGEILEETKGMYKMRLHGRAEKDSGRCIHCRRELTNPISMIYGIGPICGGHGYFATDYTKSMIKDEEQIFKLADADLRKVKWEGWVLKKAITSMTIAEQLKKEKDLKLT